MSAWNDGKSPTAVSPGRISTAATERPSSSPAPPVGAEWFSAVAPIVDGVAGRSFSSHRLHGWTRAHPVLWSAVIGLVFALASYLASAALGSRDVTTLEADI